MKTKLTPRLSKLELQLKTELAQARKDHEKASVDAATYKRFYQSQQESNKTLRDDLNHQRRLVKTLLDVLANQVHPLPTNVNLSIDYRVAE